MEGKMDTSPHSSGFVTIHRPNEQGVRLHYLDWGGSGLALVFIAGMGCTAHIFDRFAPRFTDRFHVLAVTRRGHGDSDYPETGYDADTLAGDLKEFLDAREIDQAILAGHSMGYLELSRFSQLYPERVRKLVWIDAAYDRSSPLDQAMLARNPSLKMAPDWPSEPLTSIEEYVATVKRQYPSLVAVWGPEMEADLQASVYLSTDGVIVEKMTDAISAALGDTMKTYRPNYASIHAPMLSIFVLANGRDFLSNEFMTAEQQAQVLDYFNKDRRPYLEGYIEEFRSSAPDARVVVIENGHHYCFLKQEELVYEALRAFLAE
jgi:non-heme chloroperoxidase